MKLSAVMPALVVAALLGACQPKDKPQRVEEAAQGRAETRGIRNTEAIGYAGHAIADKVDSALDAQAQARRRLDQAEAGD